MSTKTETLLTESLEALVAGQPFIPDVAGIEHRGRHLRRRAYGVRACVGIGVVVAVAAAMLVPGTQDTVRTKPSTTAGGSAGNAGSAILYRLASVSASIPPLQSRYLVLTETDTDSRVAGATLRTSVIDTQTGASTTYQHTTENGQPRSTVHTGYTGPPPILTEGPDPASTEAWFAALPTDPTALRAQLLSIAKQQATQGKTDAPGSAAAGAGVPSAIQPTLSDDDYVYEEANSLLWSPLVQPALRSALYQVLAQTSRVTVNPNATDPAGRPAIAMTRTGGGAGVQAGYLVHNIPGAAATLVSYEDPSTGAVLAQVWSEKADTMTAVYQPATSSATIPPNPYTAG
jgi:hypothetical protein